MNRRFLFFVMGWLCLQATLLFGAEPESKSSSTPDPFSRSLFGETSAPKKPANEGAKSPALTVKESPNKASLPNPTLDPTTLQIQAIAVTVQGRYALVQGKETSFLVGEGELLGEWKVLEIKNQQVILQYQDRQWTMTLPEVKK